MKIAYLARRPIPSVNAHSVQIVEMCEAFADIGHDVVLVARTGDECPDRIFDRYGVRRNFEVEVYPPRPGKLENLQLMGDLLRDRQGIEPDIFFGRDISSLSVAALVGKPIVYEAHMIPERYSSRWRLLQWLFARRNFSHLVCVTSTLAQMHRDQFEALSDKPVIIAPNGAAEPEKRPALEEWPGRAGVLQVGFVGRPFPGKGIEAMVAAARAVPELDFHIVGADRSDLGWVEGDMPSNLFFHGYQPHGDVGRYHAHFDIAAAPYGARVMNATGVESAAITSPLKLLEYMAAGLPTIVSDLPGVRDVTSGADVVELVPAGDEEAFIAAIRRLERDPARRRALGVAARRRYETRHRTISRARAVLEPLNGLAAAPPAPVSTLRTAKRKVA
jgi:glycosyltransferase involved in cell wall biosynthesis